MAEQFTRQQKLAEIKRRFPSMTPEDFSKRGINLSSQELSSLGFGEPEKSTSSIGAALSGVVAGVDQARTNTIAGTTRLLDFASGDLDIGSKLLGSPEKLEQETKDFQTSLTNTFPDNANALEVGQTVGHGVTNLLELGLGGAAAGVAAKSSGLVSKGAKLFAKPKARMAGTSSALSKQVAEQNAKAAASRISPELASRAKTAAKFVGKNLAAGGALTGGAAAVGILTGLF